MSCENDSEIELVRRLHDFYAVVCPQAQVEVRVAKVAHDFTVRVVVLAENGEHVLVQARGPSLVSALRALMVGPVSSGVLTVGSVTTATRKLVVVDLLRGGAVYDQFRVEVDAASEAVDLYQELFRQQGWTR